MIALLAFAGFLALVFAASFLGKGLRRARKQQTRPTLYIVRDEPLDIKPAQQRRRP